MTGPNVTDATTTDTTKGRPPMDSPDEPVNALTHNPGAYSQGVAGNRRAVHTHLRNAATKLRLADRAARRLSEADLYDVDFEGHEVELRQRPIADRHRARRRGIIIVPDANEESA